MWHSLYFLMAVHNTSHKPYRIHNDTVLMLSAYILGRINQIASIPKGIPIFKIYHVLILFFAFTHMRSHSQPATHTKKPRHLWQKVTLGTEWKTAV